MWLKMNAFPRRLNVLILGKFYLFFFVYVNGYFAQEAFTPSEPPRNHYLIFRRCHLSFEGLIDENLLNL